MCTELPDMKLHVSIIDKFKFSIRMLKGLFVLALSNIREFAHTRVKGLMLGDIHLIIRIAKSMKLYKSNEEAMKKVKGLQVSCNGNTSKEHKESLFRGIFHVYQNLVEALTILYQ